jgi:hypothetical protein
MISMYALVALSRLSGFKDSGLKDSGLKDRGALAA